MNDPNLRSGSLPPLLRTAGICKAFGGLQALYDVSFSVAKGNIHALIGPNGAGKTTLFNLITGVYIPDDGEIFFRDQAIEGTPSYELVKKGITRTFQNVELFENMTVLENVLVGQHARTQCGFWGALIRWGWVEREERLAMKKAQELLEFVGLHDVAQQRSGDLPFGRQRMVEIARALAASPELLLLDEPAAGLNSMETLQLGELLLRIRDQGVTLLLVEHDMSLIMEISDRIVVLDQGRKLAEGTPREIQKDKSVMAAYLGGN